MFKSLRNTQPDKLDMNQLYLGAKNTKTIKNLRAYKLKIFNGSNNRQFQSRNKNGAQQGAIEIK